MNLFTNITYQIEGGPLGGDEATLSPGETAYIWRETQNRERWMHIYDLVPTDDPGDLGEMHLVYRGRLRA